VRRRREEYEKRRPRPRNRRSRRELEKNVADSGRRKNVGSGPGSTTLATLPPLRNQSTTDEVVMRKIAAEEKTLLERPIVSETMLARSLHRASKTPMHNPNHPSTATTNTNKLQKLGHTWVGHDHPKALLVRA